MDRKAGVEVGSLSAGETAGMGAILLLRVLTGEPPYD